MYRTYIIAEIGTSHGGNLEKAKKLIEAAKESGADCAKFQVVIANEIIHPNTGLVKLPTGDIPLYDVFKSLEKPKEFYKTLKDYTESLGLDFLASPFGIDSARLLKDIGSTTYKVASPELNHLPLLDELKNYNGKLILSTGVSKLKDIERALEVVGKNNTELLHCTTSYPTPEEEYNLRVISTLSGIFGIPVGISDHSLDPVLVPVISVLMGAKTIEKHFCLSNETDGLDDPVALNPTNFRKMVDFVREYEKLHPSEGLLKLKEIYGDKRIETILGDGVKKLAPCERENYGRTNRSLHALNLIKEGEMITPENTAILRTEKVLKPGASPFLADKIYGKRAKRSIPPGEGIVLEDLI